jgi:putative membrane protein
VFAEKPPSTARSRREPVEAIFKEIPMTNAWARAAIAATALSLAGGVWAADRKGDDGDKVSRGDKSFIAKVMKDGATEVELGKLAAQNGSSPEVKQFGQRMVDDHTKAGDELQAIASKLGYTPKKAGPDKGDVKKFSKLKADKFDREYAKHMVKDHEKEVKLFEKQSEKGKSDELKQFAAKTLPTLQEHLKMARGMSGQEKQEKPKKSS